MYRNEVMAGPKHETRCRADSLQASQDIQRLHK